MQSFACALVAVLAAKSIKLGQRDPDERFPFGYGKVEFLASVISLTFLFGFGAFLAVSSAMLLLLGRTSAPDLIALPVSVISVIANYLMYRYCACVGVRAHSPAMLANAAQNRADMQSSCAVLVGIALCQLHPKLVFFDALATLIVAGMIMLDAGRSWWADVRVLVDGSLSQRTIDGIEGRVRAIGGVEAVSLVSARRMGQYTAVELLVEAAPQATVCQVQELTRAIREATAVGLPFRGPVRIFVQSRAERGGS
jgi:cation diffusion facilitator family transporter